MNDKVSGEAPAAGVGVPDGGFPNEAAMRDEKAPWPDTPEELTAYIDGLVNRPHDYGTCVYAMSLAAVAAFQYVASKLGTTGFQASCADMDVLRRTRGYKGPFMVIDGANALYPQYDLPGRLREALDEWRPWLADEARDLLAENRVAHPDVIAHWEWLAARSPSTSTAPTPAAPWSPDEVTP